MKIKTLRGKTVDTDSLTDAKAHLIELIEKSEVRSFVNSCKGGYFIWGELNPKVKGNGWITMNLPDMEFMLALIFSVDEALQLMTSGQCRLSIVPEE